MFLTVFTLLFTYLGYRSFRLARNYLSARQMGLPIIVLPVSWQDPLWAVYQTRFSFLSGLPFCSWYKYSNTAWSLHDRYETHRKLGGAFTLVSPNSNQLMLVSRENTKEALGKYKKWMRPQELYSLFNTFGDNVDTVNGDDWPRHRKIVNVGFQEKNLVKVWDEARSQAQLWFKTLLESNDGKRRSLTQLHDDTNKISGGVLMQALFGQHFDARKEDTLPVPKGHKWRFGESMQFMHANVILAWILRSMRLPKSLEPTKLKNFWERKDDLQLYLEELAADPKSEFMQTLIDANELERKTGGRGHLSDSELYGNMFVLQLAGFDTTSYTIFQCTCLLALNPEMQDWARLEAGAESYEEAFEQAVRLKAIMLETLRVYGGVPEPVRFSPNAEHMTINDKDVIIPPYTHVSVNFTGQSHSPDIWGDDASVWKPQRWIEMVDGTETLKRDLESDLLAWSYGPRICPGKKFSQVEFTAVMRDLLAEFRLEASPNLHAVLHDFEFNFTPKVKRPDQAWITFAKR